MLLASILPDLWIDYGTDLIFIAATMAAIVYVVKRLIGFLRRAEKEVTDDDSDQTI